MFEFKEIYTAYLKCRRLKRNTINALKFEQNLLENLCDLETSLNDKTYTFKRGVCFITNSPKMREVFAADFSDRVVHHIIVPLLEQIYEPKFIYDSYSNRKDKGIHNATKRALHFSRGSKYYLQLDIKNFFYTIDKDILYTKLQSMLVKTFHLVKGTKIKLDEMLWLCEKIIYQDVTKNVILKGTKSNFLKIPSHKTLFKVDKNKGLPIGNLTSQFFANVYMNDFDNFVKRELKCKRYIRYVDDFVLFENSKEKLLELYKSIVKYLSDNLALKLRDRYILKENKDGLDFLGYIIRPHYVLTRKRVVNNYKYKKAKYLSRYDELKGKMDFEEIKQFLSVQASFLGHIKHANSYKLKQTVGVINEIDPFSFDRN
ncbi:MAG: RNA-directed DNA polymerase [Campylobacterales bacterium]|nr:RNA-directed DNA polymerase [Campylobacterales bacterium]